MYIVVNYDWNDNYGSFDKFSKARVKYNEVNDRNTIIEHWNKNFIRKIVWPKHKITKNRYK